MMQAPPTEERKRWVRRVTTLLDDRLRIPGTNIRFGLDFLIGLLPWIGDVVSFVISGFLILTMARYGASGMLIVRMIGNVLLDSVVGAIPVFGNIFDLAYRANRRNLRLLEEHYAEEAHGGGAWWVLVLIVLVMLSLIALSVLVMGKVIEWLFGLTG